MQLQILFPNYRDGLRFLFLVLFQAGLMTEAANLVKIVQQKVKTPNDPHSALQTINFKLIPGAPKVMIYANKCLLMRSPL
jgi:hypothetical protein